MTINPSAQPHDVYDILDGSVSEYFQLVDDCIRPNEEINGQYRVTTTACYSQDCPVQAPSFTHVNISVNGAQMTDIENSYITATLDVTFSMSKGMSEEGLPIFIGFKQSLDALERYEILVNSNVLYQQTYVGEESFVLQNCINDTVKNAHPYTYTSSENASKQSPNVCGVYWKPSAYVAAGTDVTVTIPIKIWLNQFLVLANVKYLPSFAGRWEIKLYFNGNNIVFLPVQPDRVYDYDSGIDSTWRTLPSKPTHTGTGASNNYKHSDSGITTNSSNLDITRSFTQIGPNTPLKLNYISSATTGKSVLIPECTFTLKNCVATDIKMNTTSFLLRSDVFLALKAKYTAKPWIIPCNVLQYARFSGAPHNSDFHCTLSTSVENLDSIYILFAQNSEQHTTFFNPYLQDVKINVGDFGMIPSTSVNTYNDPRFESMVLDALNLSNSPITAMNKDLARALHGEIYNATSINTTPKNTNTKITNGDMSNFILGISLSREGYQNGVSSPNTNVNFIFYGNRISGEKTEYNVGITMMMLIDCALIIQALPNSDIPVVKLTSKSVC